MTPLHMIAFHLGKSSGELDRTLELVRKEPQDSENIFLENDILRAQSAIGDALANLLVRSGG